MYLRVANSAPALPAGVRAVPLPTVVTPAGLKRGMGYLLVGRRGRGLAGPDYDAAVSTFDIVTAITRSAQIEMQSMALQPEQFVPALTQMAQQWCSGAAYGLVKDRCVVPTDLINQLGAQYAQAFRAKLQENIDATAAGDICSSPEFIAAHNIILSDRAKLGCGYGQPGGVTAAAAAPAPSSSGYPAPAAAAGKPLGVTIQNASGGSNTQFRVGDVFRLVITGPANAQVTGSSEHDGRSGATAPFGNTDASGQAVISGTMTADTVGGWVEQWYVGGQNAGSVAFSVAAPAAAPSPGSTPAAAAPPAPAGQTAAPAPAAGSGFNFSSLTQTAATVGGFGVSWLALLAVGGIALYALGSHGKG